MLKLRINPLAIEDLKGIREYISRELENPNAALKIVRNIIDSYEKLKDFPLIGL
ncbi:MAG: type II toxin-antitoxin system RelE/ParE family toxin [Bacteroidales bacterium]|nr:type II toxin-antitoxin system RelE/ParE family toxin [Bacteroidales bacterium]